tara:strand:+ start:10231 stop:10953 length:723 start_codon:yes stop_codon:yes gene_type:complete
MKANKLNGKIISRKSLNQENVKEMYSLLTEYFEGQTIYHFRKDLDEKDSVLLLRDVNDKIQGFTTMLFMELEVDSKKVNGIFSGDTIVSKDCRGQGELAKVWSRYVLDIAEELESPLYWFLISSGPKTYRFFPNLFRSFYPNYKNRTPEFEQKIIDSYAQTKFGSDYNRNTGLISFSNSSERLKQKCAVMSDEELRDPHLKFFSEKNPRYADGLELACLAEISKANYNKRALQMFGYDEK